MIVELNQADFHRVLPLLDDGPQGVEARAVLEGNNPGWVYADDAVSPRSALIGSRGIEGFYLVGDSENESFGTALDAFVGGPVAALARSLGWSYFEVSSIGAGWDAAIERVFARRALASDGQIILRRPAHPAEVPPAEAHRIGAEQASDPFVRAKIDLFWSSTSDFLERGVGFCTVREGKVVSTCLSGFVTGKVHVIDIETAEPVRRQGAASLAARAFVEHCDAHRLTPHWDCMESNQASFNLARKLGFEPAAKYSVYYFPFDEKNAG